MYMGVGLLGQTPPGRWKNWRGGFGEAGGSVVANRGPSANVITGSIRVTESTQAKQKMNAFQTPIDPRFKIY
jgi:hypothetical protein